MTINAKISKREPQLRATASEIHLTFGLAVRKRGAVQGSASLVVFFMNIRIISMLCTLPFLMQCQKLHLNISEVYIEDRFIRINAAVENRTSEVIAIHAHNVSNNASNYYRIESKNQGLDVHSNLVNGIRPEIISINPKSSVPFRLLFAIRKANRGIYSCKLVPTDMGNINCASFEVRIERPIIEKHSNLISKSDCFFEKCKYPPKGKQ